MRIASFSDVHLGPCRDRDRFRHDESELLRFSEHLRATHDRAVLVGDVFQADWGMQIGPDPAVVQEALRRFPRLWRSWRDPFFTLIRGNHDHVTQALLGARERLLIDADALRVLFLHGDQYDRVLRGRGPDLTMWIVGRMRQRGLRAAADFFEDVLLQGANDLLNRGDPIERAAGALAREVGAHVIVAGHTHWPACRRVAGAIYANSGATARAPFRYVSIDSTQRTVSLRVYDDQLRSSHVVETQRLS